MHFGFSGKISRSCSCRPVLRTVFAPLRSVHNQGPPDLVHPKLRNIVANTPTRKKPEILSKNLRLISNAEKGT